jgi:chromosome segregation ATPase
LPGETVAPTNNSPPLTIEAPDSAARLERMERLASELADQRLHLVEEWQHFLQTQEAWHEGHSGVLPELTEAARQLEERERRLADQEQVLQSAEQSLRQQHESLAAMRAALEARQAKLTVEELAWRHERDGLLVRLQATEHLLSQRQAQLEDFRKRWTARRKEEVGRLTKDLQRCRELQRQYAALREEYDHRAAELSSEERSLSERTLALEQLELERVGRSEDAALAEKRLQKLRRQYAAQYAEAEQRLAERSRSLEAEAERLAAQTQQLHQRLEAMLERESALTGRVSEWEHRLWLAEQARDGLQQEVLLLRQHKDLSDRRCRQLQEEIERMVCTLLQQDEFPPPATKAA